MIKCCLGCGERKIGCHSICKKYTKEKEEHNKLMAVVRLENRTYTETMLVRRARVRHG